MSKEVTVSVALIMMQRENIFFVLTNVRMKLKGLITCP
jgi:hypothetical protein